MIGKAAGLSAAFDAECSRMAAIIPALAARLWEGPDVSADEIPSPRTRQQRHRKPVSGYPHGAWPRDAAILPRIRARHAAGETAAATGRTSRPERTGEAPRPSPRHARRLPATVPEPGSGGCRETARILHQSPCMPFVRITRRGPSRLDRSRCESVDGNDVSLAAPFPASAVARHGKLPPRRHEELPPPWKTEERADERGTNHGKPVVE
jgi:hypothetical protein